MRRRMDIHDWWSLTVEIIAVVWWIYVIDMQGCR